MLDSEAERHRLVSLVPPVHIAIVDAANIRLTLGEALAAAGQGSELSPQSLSSRAHHAPPTSS